jgi:DNA repair protein RecO (recombination protein O)
MLHKTKGIVISYVPYKETSIIAQIFTQKFGLESFIENGVRSPKGRQKMALFQAMTMLDLVIYQNPKKDIQRIAEMRCTYVAHTLQTDLRKSAVLMFMTEILQKSLHGNEANETLFDFVENALMLLDNFTEDFEDFHLHFMLQMSHYLGFGSRTSTEFVNQLEQHSWFLTPETQAFLEQMYSAEFGKKFLQNKAQRNQLLDTLIMYYKMYNERFDNFKTLHVLREISG